ncbi:MAG: sulfatase-like hydrolase/transferase [Verrucomicrobiota bacterium]
MKGYSIAKVCACLVLVSSIVLFASLAQAAPRQPNIIFILADDLGFGDIGPTFQNQRAAKNDPHVPAFATPRLDRFAKEGMLLRNHYSAAPVCAPSRASLLLGVTQGHSNIRDNQFDKALDDNHTLGTVLKAAGYATAAFGKWGLQGRADGKPNRSGEKNRETKAGNPDLWPAYPTKRGFDYYYGYVRHRDGHYHYPKEDGIEVWDMDREVSSGLDGCYTTDLFTARSKKWIVDHQSADPAQPFFIYLAFDTPHAKLQYPPGAFPEGGGLHGGLQWSGKPGSMINTAGGKVDGWCDPEVAEARWDDDQNPATPEVLWPNVQKRHATVVRRIDQAVGDLLQLLKDLNIDDNTLVVFTSDNGPSQESYLKKDPYQPTFFNGFGPFDGIKRDTLEGGVREPTLVRWPGHIPAGQVSRVPSGMWDWMATFADVAGVSTPAASDGVSLLPTLTGVGEQRPSTIYIEYFHGGKSPRYQQFAPSHRNRVRKQMQVVQVDGYSGLRYNVQSAEDDFEIYDVEKDPQQARDLAKETDMAMVQARMKARVLQVRRPEPSAARPYDEAAMPAASVEAKGMKPGQLQCELFEGAWPWVPDFRVLEPVSSKLVSEIGTGSLLGKKNTGAAFIGFFHAEQEGEYVFSLSSDGGTELFLHDARVIDDDFKRTGDEVSGSVRLAAGWHPLRLYYRHGDGEQKLQCLVSGPGLDKQVLSAALIARKP